MNKALLSSFALVAALVLPNLAHAQANIHPTGCAMSFRVDVGSFVFVSGGEGRGTVSCRGANGEERRSYVHIRIKGLGLGLGGFTFNGVTGSLGIQDPREIDGTYGVVNGSAGFGLAAGASLGFKGQDTGLSFAASVSGGTGFGASLMGTTWEIRTVQPRRAMHRQPVQQRIEELDEDQDQDQN